MELDGMEHLVRRFLRLLMDGLKEVVVEASSNLQVVQVVVVQVVQDLVEVCILQVVQVLVVQVAQDLVEV